MFAYILSFFHSLRFHTQSSRAAPAHVQADTQEEPLESLQNRCQCPSSASRELYVERDQRKVRVMQQESDGWRLRDDAEFKLAFAAYLRFHIITAGGNIVFLKLTFKMLVLFSS